MIRPAFIPIVEADSRILFGQFDDSLLIAGVERFGRNTIDMKSSRRGVGRRVKRFDNQMNVFYWLNGAAGNEPAFAGFGAFWPPNCGHVNVGGFDRLAEVAAGSG